MTLKLFAVCFITIRWQQILNAVHLIFNNKTFNDKKQFLQNYPHHYTIIIIIIIIISSSSCSCTIWFVIRIS